MAAGAAKQRKGSHPRDPRVPAAQDDTAAVTHSPDRERAPMREKMDEDELIKQDMESKNTLPRHVGIPTMVWLDIENDDFHLHRRGRGPNDAPSWPRW